MEGVNDAQAPRRLSGEGEMEMGGQERRDHQGAVPQEPPGFWGSPFRPLYVQVDVEAVRAARDAEEKYQREVDVMRAAGRSAYFHYFEALSYGLGHTLAFREALSFAR